MSRERHDRAHLHAPPSRPVERLADRLIDAMGTPRYLLWQTAIVVAWVLLNVVAVVKHFDPYPFILLNLAFSTQAAYATPLILIAGKRAATRDRARDDLEAVEIHTLTTVNRRQLWLLYAVLSVLALLMRHRTREGCRR